MKNYKLHITFDLDCGICYKPFKCMNIIRDILIWSNLKPEYYYHNETDLYTLDYSIRLSLDKSLLSRLYKEIN